jgi:UDP-glucose 4-epimerase
VYGRPVRLPVGEDHPVAPASFYAVNKLTLEHYLRVLGGTHGLRSVVFRLSNPYGPFWPAERKSYGIINQFIARALAGEPITIFGDGSQRRDYIHVDDVSAALLATATVGACAGQTFNLGGDEPLSIAEAVGEIAQQVGDAVVRYAPWPAEHLAVETGDYRTDGSKLRRFVDLPPPIAFRDGLRRTLASVRAGLPAGGIRGYPPSAAGAETRPSAAAEGTQA